MWDGLTYKAILQSSHVKHRECTWNKSHCPRKQELYRLSGRALPGQFNAIANAENGVKL